MKTNSLLCRSCGFSVAEHYRHGSPPPFARCRHCGALLDPNGRG